MPVFAPVTRMTLLLRSGMRASGSKDVLPNGHILGKYTWMAVTGWKRYGVTSDVQLWRSRIIGEPAQEWEDDVFCRP